MSGCPFLKFDYGKGCEVCKITNKPTNGALLCDFDYEDDCGAYKEKRDSKKDIARRRAEI